MSNTALAETGEALRECGLCGGPCKAFKYEMFRKGRTRSMIAWLCETCDLTGSW